MLGAGLVSMAGAGAGLVSMAVNGNLNGMFFWVYYKLKFLENVVSDVTVVVLFCKQKNMNIITTSVQHIYLY